MSVIVKSVQISYMKYQKKLATIERGDFKGIQITSVGGYGYVFDRNEVDKALDDFFIRRGEERESIYELEFIENNPIKSLPNCIMKKGFYYQIQNDEDGKLWFFVGCMDVNRDFEELDEMLLSLCFDLKSKERNVYIGESYSWLNNKETKIKWIKRS
ncbi:MAG: hypothetical protein GY679_02155 [Mycoplasma sp.]|nr:hypothetical protein [Mycoplasma sp.]